MFTTKIIQHGAVFHEYEILRNEQVVYSFRSDPQEANAIRKMFELVEVCAQRDFQPFPFAIVQNPDQTAVLCGPKDKELQWGPILTGPIGMLEKLLPALIKSFDQTKTQPKSKRAIK